jgi:hypothetical protein
VSSFSDLSVLIHPPIDGGSSGLPALYILDEALSRLASDLKLNDELLWRHFDMMIGTGPGGRVHFFFNTTINNVVYRLIVILIGRLRLSPSQAIDAYMKLEAVIPMKPAKYDQARIKNSTVFRAAFTEVLKEAGFEPDTPMVDENMPKM